MNVHHTSSAAEADAIQYCEKLISRYYQIVCILVGGSRAAQTNGCNDLDLCVVVREDVLSRARLRLDGVPIDVFLGSETRFTREITQGSQPHLVMLFRSARLVWGDETSGNRLKILAGEVASTPAPAPSRGALFRYRTQPYDLIRKFRQLSANDSAAASLVLSTLVRVCIDGYFALRRIWTTPIQETLQFLTGKDPRAASAVRRVLQSSLSEVCAHPEWLDEMVHLLIGPEPQVDELWIVEPSAASALQFRELAINSRFAQPRPAVKPAQAARLYGEHKK